MSDLQMFLGIQDAIYSHKLSGPKNSIKTAVNNSKFETFSFNFTEALKILMKLFGCCGQAQAKYNLSMNAQVI